MMRKFVISSKSLINTTNWPWKQDMKRTGGSNYTLCEWPQHISISILMWVCADMKQQSPKSSSVLSIQHEKQLPSDSQTTNDSLVFLFLLIAGLCTMTGGCSVQSACDSAPLGDKVKSIRHYSTHMHCTHKKSINTKTCQRAICITDCI